MANVIAMANKAWQKYSKSGGGVSLTFCAPTKERATVLGIGANNFVDFVLTDGQQAVANSVHIAFHEANLREANPTYPIRNKKGKVEMVGHLVQFADSNGDLKEYAIKTVFPDNTVGMIVCNCEYFRTVENDTEN